MITKANKFFLVIIIVFVVGVSTTVFIIWNNVNIGLNKEYLLRKTYDRYTALFNVRVCDQAYEYLSEYSKKVSGDKFKESCKDRNNLSSDDDKITQIVFINSWTAKMLRKYKVVVDGKSTSIERPQTWVFENGSWERDWPD